MFMRDRLVAMAVGVSPFDRWRMRVRVVPVVVAVLEFVFEHLVWMRVRVRCVEREGDAPGRDDEGDELRDRDGFAEHRPGDDRADERGRREDHLATRRAEIARTL